MSADNFYVLRKHPQGYCFVMGYASDDEDAAMTCDVSDYKEFFSTISEAMADWEKGQSWDKVKGGYPKYYNEYGLSMSPEVEADIAAFEQTLSSVVPVTLHYNFDDIIGGAVLESSGKVVITLHDPRVVEYIRRELKIIGVTLIHNPALPADMPVINPIADEVDQLLSPHMD